jgi:hypothetical protein
VGVISVVCGSAGLLECWNAGMLDFWTSGLLDAFAALPCVAVFEAAMPRVLLNAAIRHPHPTAPLYRLSHWIPLSLGDVCTEPCLCCNR